MLSEPQGLVYLPVRRGIAIERLPGYPVPAQQGFVFFLSLLIKMIRVSHSSSSNSQKDKK